MFRSPQGDAQVFSTDASGGGESPSHPPFYEFGPFRLDVRRRLLLREEGAVPITPKALETLLALVERRGRVVEKGELMRLLWPDTAVEEANLTQSVFLVRKALGESSGEQRFIATAPRRGYRFVAHVREVPTEPEPGHDAPGREPVGGRRGVRLGRRPFRWALRVAIAVAAIAVTAWLRAPVHRVGAIRSLAVLPLHNLSGEADDEYFADGLTDALVTDLGSVSALRVISRQSVMRYRGSPKPLPEIARELGVDAVIEGSVLRAGGRLRLTAQLVDGSSDRQVWADSFDRNLADTLKLQGELARLVAREVQVTVTEQEQALLARRRPVDPAAYDSYLRGRHFWDRRNESSLRKSIECFQMAVDRDPTLAVAWAGMALAYAPLGYWDYVPPAEARMRMQAATSKALELDASLVDAHTALASLKTIYDWDWEGAERAWRAVLARSPNNALAHQWYGLLLESLGRADEALAERTRALELDPLSLNVSTSLADTFSLMGQQDRAIQQYERTLELDPKYPGALRGLGWAYLMKGSRAKAVTKLEEAADLSGRDPMLLCWLGHAYGLVGRKADARRVQRALEERGRDRYLSPYHLAVVHAGLGETDAAFLRLDEAFRERAPVLFHAKVEPLLTPLRSDPRFQDLLRRMALE